MDTDIEEIKQIAEEKTKELTDKAIPSLIQKTLYVALSTVVVLFVENFDMQTIDIAEIFFVIVFLEFLQILAFVYVLKSYLDKNKCAIDKIWSKEMDKACEIHNKSWTENFNNSYSFYQEKLGEYEQKLADSEMERTELVLEMNRMVRKLIAVQDDYTNLLKKIRPEGDNN